MRLRGLRRKGGDIYAEADPGHPPGGSDGALAGYFGRRRADAALLLIDSEQVKQR
jgi:hypothetical protein